MKTVTFTTMEAAMVHSALAAHALTLGGMLLVAGLPKISYENMNRELDAVQSALEKMGWKA